jgi:ClpP class serine protease
MGHPKVEKSQITSTTIIHIASSPAHPWSQKKKAKTMNYINEKRQTFKNALMESMQKHSSST